jgi:hypothetical protein
MQAGVMLRRGIHMPSWALYGYEQTTPVARVHADSKRPERQHSGRRPGHDEPAGRRRWLILAVIALAQLMVVLDATIVKIALPSVQRSLHSLSTGSGALSRPHPPSAGREQLRHAHGGAGPPGMFGAFLALGAFVADDHRHRLRRSAATGTTVKVSHLHSNLSASRRTHDLRHSFAVASMLDAYAAGQDGQACLALLSTYLGHASPDHT